MRTTLSSLLLENLGRMWRGESALKNQFV